MAANRGTKPVSIGALEVCGCGRKRSSLPHGPGLLFYLQVTRREVLQRPQRFPSLLETKKTCCKSRTGFLPRQPVRKSTSPTLGERVERPS